MNPQATLDRAAARAKPRSRGDEPKPMVGFYSTKRKTPLTRG